MKFKTFRGLGIAAAVATMLGGCGLLSWWCASLPPAPKREDRTASTIRTTTAPSQPGTTVAAAPVPTPERVSQGSDAARTSAPGGETPLRPMDQEIMKRAGQSISGDKVKDAIPGRSYKVNLYQDAGEPRVNRLKVDLDRDEKWDEKWTLPRDSGEIKRQVSPADDDTNYPEEYRLRGTVWVRK